jgi:segregation and condensation protein B
MDIHSNRLPIVEALIVSASEPITSRKIAEVVDDTTPHQVDEIIEALNSKYQENDVSFRIRKIAGGYQMYILENYAGYVDELYTRRRTTKLSRAALETLAIIAYRQPVTKGDIEMIRGVSSDSAINTLLQRKLITLSGRAKTLGRPLLYSTTAEFLKYFSLNSLDDLPRMEEIEELLAAVEPDNQQSLTLDEGKKTVRENPDENLDDRNDGGSFEEAESDEYDADEEDTFADDFPPEELSEEEEEFARLIDSAVDETLARHPEFIDDVDEPDDNAGETLDMSEETDAPEESMETEEQEEEETVNR